MFLHDTSALRSYLALYFIGVAVSLSSLRVPSFPLSISKINFAPYFVDLIEKLEKIDTSESSRSARIVVDSTCDDLSQMIARSVCSLRSVESWSSSKRPFILVLVKIVVLILVTRRACKRISSHATFQNVGHNNTKLNVIIILLALK